MRIDNWSLCVVNPDPYRPPEAQSRSLQGNVYGHPKFEDGTHITTSTIIGRTEDGKLRTAGGSQYELGSVDPAYEQAFPNAKARVLKCLPV